MSSIFSKIFGIQLGTNPSNPPSGRRVLFAKSDGWYDKNSAGTVTKLAFESATAAPKVYHATLTGTNDANPTVVVAKTDLAETVTWTRNSEGNYEANTGGLTFTLNKTNIQHSLGVATGATVVKLWRSGANLLQMTTFAADGTTPADFIGTIDVAITVHP